MKTKKKSNKGRIIFIIVLVLVAIFAIYKATFAANRGLDTGGVAYVCTEAGTIEGTSTDTPMIHPIVIKTIVFMSAADTDTAILVDGANTETMLQFRGTQVVSFGEGKTFKKGLRVHSMTSGAKIFIYPK